jgi:hypothetical protein
VATSLRGLGVAVVAVAALAGCSSASGTTETAISDQEPAQILAQATANAKAQSTVRVKGNGSCPDGAFFTDMHLRKDGFGAGSVKFGPDTLSVVGTPTALYVNGPAAFWKAQATAAVAATIGTNWVSFPKGSNVCLATLASFTGVLDNYLGYTGSPTKKSGGKILTVPAVELVFSPSVSLWVASTGTPLPVHVDDTDAGTALAMGEWSADVQVNVPPSIDVIDSSVLAKKN